MRRVRGNTVTSDVIFEPDFEDGVTRHCCSIEDSGTPSLSGVVTWSVCPTVYNSVQMCVYLFEAKTEECVCMGG